MIIPVNTPLTEERFVVLLNTIIDKKLDERFTAFEKKIEYRFTRIEERLEDLGKRLGILEEQFETFGKRLGTLEERSLEHSDVFTSIYEILHTLTTMIDNHYLEHTAHIQNLDKRLRQFMHHVPSREEFNVLTLRLDSLENRILN